MYIFICLSRYIGGGLYLFNNRPKRLRQWHLQPGKGDIRRSKTPIQRTHVVRLRRWDLIRNLRFPCPPGCLGLLDARVGEVGVKPGYVFVAVLEGPVALYKWLLGKC